MHSARPLNRLIVAAIAGVIAFALVLLVTAPPGPGLDPDAVSYIMAAKSLAHSGVLRAPTLEWAPSDTTMPLGHFPPGFPAMIAAPVILGMQPVQAARLVVAVSAFFTVSATVWLVASASSVMAGVLAGLLLLVTPAIVDVHLAVLSEPLFLACIAVTLIAMTRERIRPLASGVVAAIACLIRYAGVSATAAVAIWMFAQPGTLQRRVRRAMMAALPSVLVLGAWVIRASRVDNARIRVFGVYPDLSVTLREGLETTTQWLVPLLSTSALRGAVAALVAIGCALVIVRTMRARPAAHRAAWWRVASDATPSAVAQRLIAACGLLVVTYVGTLVISRVAADPGIPFDFRLLAPLFFLCTIAISVAIGAWWPTASTWSKSLTEMTAGAWVIASLISSTADARYALTVGVDFADEEWRTSQLIDWVRHQAGGRFLFTNFPTALYFQADRAALPLPTSLDPAELRAFADTLVQRDGLVIAFTRPSDFEPPPQPLLRALPVHAIASFPDGAVWAVDDTARSRAAAARAAPMRDASPHPPSARH